MGIKTILIADDESRMRKLVGDVLRKEGYQIIEAADGKQALDLFQQQPIDLIIVDVMMPEYDGWTVCREIRKSSPVPIIMLTARSQETDELFGFELGADEYISKPFSLEILLARVRALLRRIDSKVQRSFEGIDIDESGRQVFIDGTLVDLSPKEYDLLNYMIINEGRALSREQILNAVWDYNYFGDGRTVDTHIKKLRLKLGNKSTFIQTVRSYGYRFEGKK